MNGISRLLVGGSGSILVTSFLTLGMIELIKVEFQIDPEVPDVITDIGANIIDVEYVRGRTRPAPLRVITPPPAPEPIAHATTYLPDEGTPVFEDKLPEMDLDLEVINRTPILELTTEMVPIHRETARMPLKAEKSGHCKMKFDVGPDGSPLNINAIYCTDAIFRRESLKATAKFKYKPRIVEGMAVTVSNVETRISYNLMDENGKRIPE